jgi:uncharacterized Ntn-hydrolase superfamily protein
MTYSIVARDPDTGELGVAVQSHWFGAGGIVAWAESGVGAVATQATVEVGYGPRGLERMRAGDDAAAALAALGAEDPGADVRQVAMVDTSGEVAAHTGARCIPMAGHRIGAGYSVQANMMWNDTVWDAMAEAYEASPGDLIHRLLDALDAAEAEGGDIRGRQAAGILVVRADRTERPWEDTLLRVMIDDHPEPLAELRRVVEVKLAYDRMNRAEELALQGDREGAAREGMAALLAQPDSAELAFWSAVSLAGEGQVDLARSLIATAYRAGPGWRELLRRLADGGLIEGDEQAVRALLDEDGPA